MKGRCFCGRIRLTTSAAPVAVRTCWCRDCQYLGAGSGTVNAVFATESVAIDGDISEYVSTADSGATMTRGFCAHCGTPVSSRSDTKPKLVVLRVGLFDDPSALVPALTIWTESAPDWACLDEKIPGTPRQPPPLG